MRWLLASCLALAGCAGPSAQDGLRCVALHHGRTWAFWAIARAATQGEVPMRDVAQLASAVRQTHAAPEQHYEPPQQPAGTRHLRVGAVFQDAPFAPEMIVVPQGAFLMGSPDGQGEEAEHPQHRVSVAGFAMDVTEVTVAAYGRCVSAGGKRSSCGSMRSLIPHSPATNARTRRSCAAS